MSIYFCTAKVFYQGGIAAMVFVMMGQQCMRNITGRKYLSHDIAHVVLASVDDYRLKKIKADCLERLANRSKSQLISDYRAKIMCLNAVHK